MEKREQDVINWLSSARPTQLMQSIAYLKEKHDVLKAKVVAIQAKSKEVRENLDAAQIGAIFHILRREIQLLTKELDELAEWENQELFPVIKNYFNLHVGPSIIPTIWVLERDHELAKQFVQPFLSLSQGITAELYASAPVTPDMIERCKLSAAHLIQACLILMEHFDLEEELVYPLAGELLTDIDYLYS